MRRWHRIIGLVLLFPILLSATTGLLLLQRGRVEWIQPKVESAPNPGQVIPLPLPEIYQKATQYFQERHKLNAEVEQIIYRPGKNNVAIRFSNDWEMQLKAHSGEVIKFSPRRTNWLIRLHEGKWAQGIPLDWVMALSALGLIFLGLSGVIIWNRMGKPV